MDYPASYPPQPPTRPAVVMWFKIYAGVLVAMYLAMSAISLMFFLMDPVELNLGRTEALVVGCVILIVGLPLAAASAVPFFAPPRPWVWVYSIVLICLGMTSACF